jgi:hypothetical protein
MGTNGNTDTGVNLNDNKHSPDSEGLGVYGNDNVVVGQRDVDVTQRVVIGQI